MEGSIPFSKTTKMHSDNLVFSWCDWCQRIPWYIRKYYKNRIISVSWGRCTTRVLRSIEGDAVRMAWAANIICSISFRFWSPWLWDTVSTMVSRCFNVERVLIESCMRLYETRADTLVKLTIVPCSENICTWRRLGSISWISDTRHSTIRGSKMTLTLSDSPRDGTFNTPFKYMNLMAMRG